MAQLQEPTETQGRAVVAAEISSAPDGTHVVCLATRRHAFQARAHLVAGSAHAAILLGPSSAAGTLAELSGALASQGLSTLCVHPRAVLPEAESLACCAEFLRQRGARTLSLVALGPCAPAALAAACSLDADRVLLLAPSQTPAEPRGDLLRGRPLLVCTCGERWRCEPLAGLPHAERRHFARCGEAFDEARSDLLAICVPFLAGAGRAGAPVHP